MPMYDFYCPNCQKEFEELVRPQQENAVCPHCGNNKTERKMSIPSPLKTGAFPFKPGPVRPISKGANTCASCKHS